VSSQVIFYLMSNMSDDNSIKCNVTEICRTILISRSKYYRTINILKKNGILNKKGRFIKFNNLFIKPLKNIENKVKYEEIGKVINRR